MLLRMRRNRNPCALLVGMQKHGAASSENGLAIPQRVIRQLHEETDTGRCLGVELLGRRMDKRLKFFL